MLYLRLQASGPRGLEARLPSTCLTASQRYRSYVHSEQPPKSSSLYLPHSDGSVCGSFLPFPARPLPLVVCEILKCRNQVFHLWVSTTFWAQSTYFKMCLNAWVHVNTNLELTQDRGWVKLWVRIEGFMMYWHHSLDCLSCEARVHVWLEFVSPKICQAHSKWSIHFLRIHSSNIYWEPLCVVTIKDMGQGCGYL